LTLEAVKTAGHHMVVENNVGCQYMHSEVVLFIMMVTIQKLNTNCRHMLIVVAIYFRTYIPLDAVSS